MVLLLAMSQGAVAEKIIPDDQWDKILSTDLKDYYHFAEQYSFVSVFQTCL